MKLLKRLIKDCPFMFGAWVAIMLCGPILVTMDTGCTTSQQRVTYNSLFSVGTAVNSAYAAYNDQVVAGKATFSPNVAKTYNDFQSIFNVAVTAASTNPNAIAPQNVVDAANAVYAAIKQFTK